MKHKCLIHDKDGASRIKEMDFETRFYMRPVLDVLGKAIGLMTYEFTGESDGLRHYHYKEFRCLI